ncbi:MAG TPA: hypothetical protein DCF78_08595, partial [Dehalococcoidia bacterium]|nr:hypothetical protein [Dehalococcoidia bacterium]
MDSIMRKINQEPGFKRSSTLYNGLAQPLRRDHAMKITDVKPIPTQPTEYSRRANRTWTFVQIDTDEGITGYGEATNYPGGGSLVVASTINQVRET